MNVDLIALPPVLTAAEKKDAHTRAKLAKEDAAKAKAAAEYPPRAPDKEVRAAKKRAESASRINADVAVQTAKKPTRKELAAAKHATQPATEPTVKVSRETKTAPAIPTTGYQGPMLALRDRLKAGQYKKAANGQPSCGDEVANVLGQLEPTEVIAACLIALDIANPYKHLNIGQQSMNLRNKLRGALKHEKFGMGVLREAVEEVIEARPAKTPAAE